jgi:Pyridoxamine 5'-phosphate oxidase
MKWDEFAHAAPELAALAREAFDEQHISILGTLRANGWPRVSPCEIYFVDGELLLGMMPNSAKALDLRRDPRITVVNGQSEREPRLGDIKIYGLAREITDQQLRDHLADAQEAAIDWRPTDPFHVFAVDILTCSYISFGDKRKVLRWSLERGTERLRHPDEAGGEG